MDKDLSPLVSVVIPIYKAEATLPSCIDSLIGQSYRPLELLFVDDCSPDRGAGRSSAPVHLNFRSEVCK